MYGTMLKVLEEKFMNKFMVKLIATFAFCVLALIAWHVTRKDEVGFFLGIILLIIWWLDTLVEMM